MSDVCRLSENHHSSAPTARIHTLTLFNPKLCPTFVAACVFQVTEDELRMIFGNFVEDQIPLQSQANVQPSLNASLTQEKAQEALEVKLMTHVSSIFKGTLDYHIP